MSSFTFSPLLGWAVGGVIALVMLALAIAEVVRHTFGAPGDETMLSCVRRMLICLTVGAMALGPSMTVTTTSRAVNNTDVVMAVDVTGSMAVKDARYGSDETMTRLQAAKKAVDDLTKTYADSSFAAVRFGASGTLDVPLTPDAAAIRNWAATLAPEATSVSSGSSLDAPLDQLITTLKDIRSAHPDDAIVLYLITDGEQTSAQSRRTFSTLRHYLNDAFVVGAGSTEGGKIPLIEDGVSSDASSDSSAGSSADSSDSAGSSTGSSDSSKSAAQQWVTDPDTGQPGISKMDETTLKNLADEMGGSVVELSAQTTMTNGRSAEASKKWSVGVSAKQRTRANPVVWPLAAVAAVLIAWETGATIAMSRRLL
ncbi:VWA domain-containing protein [Bifidobacterium sp. 64T4]|uniref:vWA domain-containing protein n=1 Tax=Bifidobacterium pongonis TaxID=2834432 RepID=UPI001C5A441C|nr:vWA domain-containing protein [Bifidobacterium pongonis]MBW3094299.1 VWA domain-containing protein [Bifidobacterium pongonis]